MRVIIIKDCKDGKINDVVEVADGYGKNFLIKKGLATPFNVSNKHKLESRIHLKEVEADYKKTNSLKVKNKIDATTLNFKLKATNDVIHGSVTRKQIMKELKLKKININPLDIENVRIHSLGITNVSIKLFDGIKAILKVEVSKDE